MKTPSVFALKKPSAVLSQPVVALVVALVALVGLLMLQGAVSINEPH
tara:strand:+ start:538 stop:678 length:141 start_codon:yes stop_codon:yes gene_type:complete